MPPTIDDKIRDQIIRRIDDELDSLCDDLLRLNEEFSVLVIVGALGRCIGRLYRRRLTDPIHAPTFRQYAIDAIDVGMKEP